MTSDLMSALEVSHIMHYKLLPAKAKDPSAQACAINSTGLAPTYIGCSATCLRRHCIGRRLLIVIHQALRCWAYMHAFC